MYQNLCREKTGKKGHFKRERQKAVDGDRNQTNSNLKQDGICKITAAYSLEKNYDPAFFNAFLNTRCLSRRATLAESYSNFPEMQYSPMSVPWSWQQQLSFFQLRQKTQSEYSMFIFLLPCKRNRGVPKNVRCREFTDLYKYPPLFNSSVLEKLSSILNAVF